jgi:hypothetical protein
MLWGIVFYRKRLFQVIEGYRQQFIEFPFLDSRSGIEAFPLYIRGNPHRIAANTTGKEWWAIKLAIFMFA